MNFFKSNRSLAKLQFDTTMQDELYLNSLLPLCSVAEIRSPGELYKKYVIPRVSILSFWRVSKADLLLLYPSSSFLPILIVFLVCIVNGKEGKGNQTQKIFVLFLVAKSTEATGRRKAARHSFGGHSITAWTRRGRYLKSINSNFTLAVHSPKFGQAKTHFLSHFEREKKKKYDKAKIRTHDQ